MQIISAATAPFAPTNLHLLFVPVKVRATHNSAPESDSTGSGRKINNNILHKSKLSEKITKNSQTICKYRKIIVPLWPFFLLSEF